MRYREEARAMLLAADVFVALTSIACGAGLAVGVLQFPLAFLDGTPFSDYTLPGLVMALVVGGVALLAAATLAAGRASGVGLSALAGLILLLFEVAEVGVIDRNTGDWLPLVVALQSVYTALGLVMVGAAALLRTPECRWWPARMRYIHAG